MSSFKDFVFPTFGGIIVACSISLAISTSASAQASSIQTPTAKVVTTLFSFAGGKGGAVPSGGLAAFQGKLYGATVAAGGTGKTGTVFSFDPTTNGLKILHAFTDGIDGEQPYAGPTSLGQLLYGTTFQGGAVGFGTVYRLDPDTGRLHTLHSFTSEADGGHPESQLAVLNGALYGTTYDGGNAPEACIDTNFYWGCGVIFKYDPVKNRTTVVHAFNGPDGFLLPAPLTAANGLLYGVTERGGPTGEGSVFSLDPVKGLLKTLHSFSFGPHEGAGPVTGVIVVGRMLYGIAAYGGSTKLCITGPERCGSIFQIDLKSGAFTTLYRFSGGSDGFSPSGLFYGNGLIYGLTYGGGKHGRGSIFTLDPATQAVSTIYSFTGGIDGANPAGALTSLGGNLYGITIAGGSAGQGTIFEVTP